MNSELNAEYDTAVSYLTVSQFGGHEQSRRNSVSLERFSEKNITLFYCLWRNSFCFRQFTNGKQFTVVIFITANFFCITTLADCMPSSTC